MDIDQLVDSLVFRFQASGIDNAKRVAEELLAHVFDCRPLEIYTGAADGITTPSQQFKVIQKLEPMAERIENGEPLQYVIGSVNFWGLNFKCDKRALIPRPETELLVEEVLSSTLWENKPATVVDVGTGSGCIVITLAKHRPDAAFKAVDLSPDALELAKENAREQGIAPGILWMQNRLLDRFAPQSCDAVVANLPYIATEEWRGLSPAVREHEPRMALDSGPSGLELIEELATQARYVLVPGGMLFLEFGHEQGPRVAECLKKLNYQNIQIKHDLAGHDRIAIAQNTP